MPIQQWLPAKNRPLLISGPCSAESREQVIKTATTLEQTGLVSAFRAGVWKPRTSAQSFEGHGEQALLWLREAKEKTSMPLAVEVAHPKHVELCLEHKIDILWIGARSVANPFSIQEISEALKGVDIPVMIKNPVNPDLNLWIGALERLSMAGINKLAAIHRGFNTWEINLYRNTPLWEIPVELKRLFPKIPLICDPSHICGNRKMIEKVAQHALDLDMDGLMIESHINPNKALSDKKQQITPHKLQNIISNLQIKYPGNFEKKTAETITELREQIDVLDKKLLEILAERMNVVKNIGYLKKNNKITILQIERWDKIIRNRKEKGLKLGLDKDFLKKMLNLVHNESINVQKRIMNDVKKKNTLKNKNK